MAEEREEPKRTLEFIRISIPQSQSKERPGKAQLGEDEQEPKEEEKKKKTDS